MLTEPSVLDHRAGKQQLRNRLHLIEGHVRGIERMVEEDRPLHRRHHADLRPLDKVALGVLDGHTRHCLAGHATDGVTDELTAAVARLGRRG